MMTLAAISNFTKNIPHHLYQAGSHIKHACGSTANWASTHLKNLWGRAKENATLKPLYTRYIQPLDLKDALLFVGFTFVACTVAMIAISFFGTPMIALVTIGAFSLCCVSLLITKKRIENKTSLEVAEVFKGLVELHLCEEGIQPENIVKARDTLQHIERDRLFDHLKDEMKNFATHSNRFLDNVSNGKEDKYGVSRKTLVDYLQLAIERLTGRSNPATQTQPPSDVVGVDSENEDSEESDH